MSNYKIEDLRGKYVKAGTPEAGVFLDACEALGVVWCSDKAKPRDSAEASRDGAILTVYNDGKDSLSWQVDSDTTDTRGNRLEMFTTKPQWTIHNNDKPLRELSDEQAAQLINSWRKGAIRERKTSTGWCMLVQNSTSWDLDVVYRIKPKSEREAFVERCLKYRVAETVEFAEKMFNAGFRFVEGAK